MSAYGCLVSTWNLLTILTIRYICHFDDICKHWYLTSSPLSLRLLPKRSMPPNGVAAISVIILILKFSKGELLAGFAPGETQYQRQFLGFQTGVRHVTCDQWCESWD